MKRKEIILVLTVILGVTIFFFHKAFFFGQIPFPGDLLITEYNPWKTDSFLGYNRGTFPSKLQYFDTARQIYPWKTLAVDLFKNFQIPLWNPYNFSGSPVMANFQSSVFYPLNIFYFFLNQKIAWTIMVFLQPFLAILGTYLFSRKIKLGVVPSLFSSVAYGFSLFMTVFLEYNTLGHIMALFPISLYSLEHFFEKRTPVKTILLAGTVVFMIFAGHIQIAIFALMFVIIYSCFRILSFKKQKIQSSIMLFMVFVLSLGISSIQLLPSFELISHSARTPQEYNFLIQTLLIQPYQLVLLFSPDIFGNPVNRNYLITDTYPGNALYVGFIPVIFALFSLQSIKKNRNILFFFVISLIFLLLFVRSPISELFYHANIPFFSTGSPTNGIFLLSFCLSLLSGFGLDIFIKEKRNIKILGILVMVAIVLGLYAVGFKPIINVKNVLLTGGILCGCTLLIIGTYVIQNLKRFFVLGFFFITVFDLFFFFQKFNPFVPGQLVFPDNRVFDFLQKNAGINRFWGYGAAAIEANFATQYKLFSPDGYDPLYPKWYGEFIQASQNGRLAREFDNTTRSDARVDPEGGEQSLMANSHRLRVLDLLGVKYIIDKKGSGTSENTFPSSRFKEVYADETWRVYENLIAVPRAFLTSEYETYSSKDEFEKLLFSKNFNPSKTLLFKKGSVSDNSRVDSGQVTLSLTNYSPNKIEFQTNADSPQYLFLSDTFYPGWKAQVDSNSVTILQADYAFRAVPVPAGSHKVILRYDPDSFSTGWKLSIISGVLLVALAFWAKRIKYVA